ncbi:MAG: hypothetical protein WA609_03105, partial [Terriglobales bacterium]
MPEDLIGPKSENDTNRDETQHYLGCASREYFIQHKQCYADKQDSLVQAVRFTKSHKAIRFSALHLQFWSHFCNLTSAIWNLFYEYASSFARCTAFT